MNMSSKTTEKRYHEPTINIKYNRGTKAVMGLKAKPEDNGKNRVHKSNTFT